MIVRHSRGEYPIHFASLSEAFSQLPSDRVVVTDETVRDAFADRLEAETRIVAVPAGEASKSLASFGSVVGAMARLGCSRRTTVVALGGGVVGDLAGYAAASFMRGVPYVQIPTTLLAQVDSSVGGKVGIDLPEGKNLVGAFHAPERVFVSVDALRSLPERQFVNGMAEVVKYGFILDAAFADRFASRRTSADAPDLEGVVRYCVELKRQTVEADEFERLGIRAKLNFGHTVGHAIEQVLAYERFLHGEAISIGMVAEARLGERLGITAQGTTERVAEILSRQGLPTAWDGLRDAEPLIAAMYRDKKAHGSRLAFSLLTEVGQCKLVEGVDEAEVRAALKDL